jgi:hypothetical protein
MMLDDDGDVSPRPVSLERLDGGDNHGVMVVSLLEKGESLWAVVLAEPLLLPLWLLMWASFSMAASSMTEGAGYCRPEAGRVAKCGRGMTASFPAVISSTIRRKREREIERERERKRERD